MTLEQIIEQIRPANEASMEAAKARWMSVAKPLFSLGKLESAVIKIAGIKGTSDFSLDKKGLIIMCADNGVVEEGVTQTGQEVTAIVADNFTKDAASVVIMSKTAGVNAFPIDIGMVTDVPSVTRPEHKVMHGTKNFAKEPAMTKEQVLQAINIGIELVKEKKEAGYDILATGEMGIGNTTTSSAVAAVLLDTTVESVTGRGAGLSGSGLEKKIQVIKEAISKYGLHSSSDIIEVMAAVGGLDIAGMTGLYLGGAIYGVPIVIDGFISSVAALCATRIAPNAKDYMLPSHVSKEPAGMMMLDALGVSPLLTCDMCLGEGSGAIAVLPILEMGLNVYKQMGTFQENQIEEYKVLK
ncbi:MAG: nicotinate-nucleotide--dimethylbenzimidazole phosphoribosyltransferase [Eubacterium sp.]|nr:nicotinate-nucleotide--dimethylbenzimidazole phosphoribosyltransferase [Eubacterium sp.]